MDLFNSFVVLWRAVSIAHRGKYEKIKTELDCYGIRRWHPESLESFQEYVRARDVLSGYLLLTTILSILRII